MDVLTLPRDMTLDAPEALRTSVSKLGVPVRASVLGVSPDVPFVRADGEQGQHFMLNKKALGSLWGKVKHGDVLELSVLPAAGQPTKILSVRRV